MFFSFYSSKNPEIGFHKKKKKKISTIVFNIDNKKKYFLSSESSY